MSGNNGQGDKKAASWASRNSSAPRMGRIGDWSAAPSGSGSGGPSQGGRRPAAGSDGSDDDEAPEGESWFAGGERSGINVENPDRARVPGGNLVKNLLRRAAEAGPPPDPSQPQSRAFTGGGHTLGSDEVESTFIPDPSAAPSSAEAEQTAIRHLTFWKEGFSVDEGELMRYDDPANEQILEEINSGRAPPSILNVLPGQPVELRVARRLNESYVPPVRGAFSGSGNRLGAPSIPTTFEAAHGSTPMPGAFSTGARCPVIHGDSAASGSSSSAVRTEPETESFGTRFEVDQTQPTTSVQIRLADGTRIVSRMNLTHTVQDLRNFIIASRPENASRPFTIGTTFPNRTLEDDKATIADAGLANTVIVQRWA